MLTYENYVFEYGAIDQTNFEAYLQLVNEQFWSVVYTKVPYWRINDVDLSDKALDKAYAIQIRLLKGIDFLNTQFDTIAGISSVTTDGFTIDYSIRNKEGKQFPMSTVAASILTNYLRSNGHMRLGVM